jgi:hypothetical protein
VLEQFHFAPGRRDFQRVAPGVAKDEAAAGCDALGGLGSSTLLRMKWAASDVFSP